MDQRAPQGPREIGSPQKTRMDKRASQGPHTGHSRSWQTYAHHISNYAENLVEMDWNRHDRLEPGILRVGEGDVCPYLNALGADFACAVGQTSREIGRVFAEDVCSVHGRRGACPFRP